MILEVYYCGSDVCIMLYSVLCFKQKTAYEVRISDWSSDVCSSDLPIVAFLADAFVGAEDFGDDDDRARAVGVGACDIGGDRAGAVERRANGRASCRDRVWKYV